MVISDVMEGKGRDAQEKESWSGGRREKRV